MKTDFTSRFQKEVKYVEIEKKNYKNFKKTLVML